MNLRLRVLIAVLSLTLTCLTAQAQQPGNANPPAGSLPASSQTETEQAAPEPTNAPVADTRPLTGAEEIGVGLRSRGRNYVLPSLQIYAYGDLQ